MPISKRQLIANRLNAQKSTGPRTESGKQNSAANSTTHGLYSNAPVIKSPHLKENPDEYDDLLRGLINDFQPRGHFENQLVNVIANCLWRQRRCMNAEVAMANRELYYESRKSYNDDIFDVDYVDRDVGMLGHHEKIRAARALVAQSESIPRIEFSVDLFRMEKRIDNRLTRAFAMLQLVQAQRRAREENQNRENEPILPKPNAPESNTANFNGDNGAIRCMLESNGDDESNECHSGRGRLHQRSDDDPESIVERSEQLAESKDPGPRSGPPKSDRFIIRS